MLMGSGPDGIIREDLLCITLQRGHAGHRLRPAAAAELRDQEGEKRTVYEVEVDDVGPSLRNASAKVSRAQRSGAGFGGGQGGQGSPGGGRQEDPWASDNGGGYSDEPLF